MRSENLDMHHEGLYPILMLTEMNEGNHENHLES
jgi:hypothetical protein